MHSDSTVTVILRGGLGNQMFEYAAGLNLAIARHAKLLLDTTYLNDRLPRWQITRRAYDLDIFKIIPSFTLLSKISSKIPLPGVWTGINLAAVLGKKIFRISSNPILWGFFHREDYFIDNRAAVREAFRFKYPLVGEAARSAEEIKETQSVSLHVRRGDYLLPKYRKLYGDTEVAYYNRAIEYIGKRVSRPRFFVFSDDIDWCKKNIMPPFPVTYLDSNTAGQKDSFHLELISHCKHNIIANSSFSWWGAWLNANPEKIVVAPRRWYLKTEIEDVENNIVPNGWTRI